MPDWVWIVLSACLAVITLGAYGALSGVEHHRKACGDHVLSIIRWRDEAGEGDDE